MISFLVWLLVLILIIWLVYYVLGMLPLPPQVKNVVVVILAVIFLIVLLQQLGLLLPPIVRAAAADRPRVEPQPLPAALTFPPEAGDVLALPLRVIDGDTIEFAVLVRQTGRLAGINAPEVHSPDPKEKAAGLAAKAYLAKILPDRPCRATIKGREKYGRALVVIETADGKNLSQMMLDAGQAKPYDGKGPRP